MQNIKMLRSPLTVLYLFLCIVPSGALAQTTFGTFTGTVTDSSGAVLPDAKVVVTNEGTNQSREVTTDKTGGYVVPSVLPGVYTISVELSGFKKALQSGITLQVNQTLRSDFIMQVGEITQTVDVEAAAPLLQSETSTVGTVIENKQVVELPLNGRSFTELTTLVPGAVPSPNPTFKTSGTNVAVSGGRSENNNYTLDGVNNNETFFLSYGVQPSIDAIQEFKIQTNITSSEFGSAAGANINVATKNGTNNLHGGVFEFLRNNVFDARDFFATEKPSFRQNQFGGQLGGPIYIPKVYNGKDRTFFFLNYEGFRFRRASTILSTIPTPDQLGGNLSKTVTGEAAPPIFDPATTRSDPNNPAQFIRDPFPGNIIPPDRIDPIVKLYAQTFYPAPNRPGSASNLVNSRSGQLDTNQFTVRVDHRFSDKNTMFGRFSYSQNEQLNQTSVTTVENTLINAFRNAMISDTHVFSATTILDIKLAYHRNNLTVVDSTPGGLEGAQGFLDTTGIQGVPIKGPPLRPQFMLQSYANPSQTGFPFPDDTYQGLVSLSKTMGRHFMKGGFDIQNRRNLDDGFFTGNYNFTKDPTVDPQNAANTGQDLAAYLLGLPNSVLRNTGDTTALMRWSLYHFYFQDDFKVSPKLTLNLGLRYEYTQWPVHRDDKLGSYDYAAGKYIWTGVNPITGEPPNTIRTVVPPDRNNFAPRFGIAYLLNNKTTIRVGFGVFFNSNFLWLAQGIRGNWPYAISENFSNLNTGQTSTPVKTAFPSYTSIQPGIQVPPSAQHIVNRGNRVGYSEQYNIHLQREVGNSIVLEAGYVATAGLKQSVYSNINTAPPGPYADSTDLNNHRPHPDLGVVSDMANSAHSIYHGLQLKAEKRFSQGLSFLGTYTWSHNISVLGDGFSQSQTAQNPDDARADRGLSNFDHRHIFAFNYVYELPFGKGKPHLNSMNAVGNSILGGWQINGIITARAGAPFNVFIPRDIANIGARSISERPNVSGDPNISGGGSVERWFNTDVFSEPAPYTYGNAGRNIVVGPGHHNWNFGLFKNFQIREEHRIQFRVEFFNLWNHTNFGLPSGNFDDKANFGRITSSDPARQIQFALKYNF
jgi:hypothetical protein